MGGVVTDLAYEKFDAGEGAAADRLLAMILNQVSIWLTRQVPLGAGRLDRLLREARKFAPSRTG